MKYQHTQSYFVMRKIAPPLIAITYGETIHGTEKILWIKFVVILVIFCFAGLAHAALRIRLEQKITATFDKLEQNPHNTALKTKVRAQETIAKYAILISVWKNKSGKKDRREKITQALKDQGFDPKKNILTDEAFLVPKNYRAGMASLFFILGLIALIIPIIQIEPAHIAKIVDHQYESNQLQETLAQPDSKEDNAQIILYPSIRWGRCINSSFGN